MSYLSRPDWPPRPTPCDIVQEELRDIFAILELLSLRLRRLEERDRNEVVIDHHPEDPPP
jgi:hypothetical protein